MKRYYSFLSSLLPLFFLLTVIYSQKGFAVNSAKAAVLVESWSFENSLKFINPNPSLGFAKKLNANLKSTPDAMALRVVGADIGTKNPTCNGANDGKAWVNSITIFAGSPGPFTYTWTLLGVTVATGDTAKNLGGGSYILKVFDANDNTTFSKGFTITNPIDLAANMFPVDETCFGACDGAAFTGATGGTQFSGGTYKYLWSTNETTDFITGLCVGTYTVTITDSAGCTTSDNITVGGPTLIQPNVTVTPVKCKGDNDGTASSNPSGGVGPYSWLWSNSATTSSISNLVPGNYTVTVTDNTACAVTQTVSITEPATLLSASISIVNPISCDGNTDGILTANGIGGVSPYTSYVWSNSQNTKTIINLSAGTYTVTVTDNNGCSKTATTTLVNPSPVTAAITLPATNVSCNGLADGSATVVPGGGIGAPYTFLWSDNQTNSTATGLAAGTYTVTVFDGNNCEGVDQITITEPATLVASIKNPVKNISCFGGSDGEMEAEGTGGTLNYSFLWSNATTTALNSGLTPGTYTVTITDANGCTSVAQNSLTEPTQVSVSISQTSSVLCNGGNQGALLAVGANGTPGYNYSWSNSVNSAANSGLTAGTYTVTVTDANLCTAINQFTIGEPATVSAAINTFSQPLCNGQSNGFATVTPSGGTPGYTYLWSTTATTQTINGLSSGTYSVTVNDVNNCSAVTQITLNDLSTVTATINLPATNVSCFAGNDGVATVTPGGGAGGYTYLWSDNQTTQTANGLLAGNYTVTVSDANGCTATDQVVINEPTALVASIKNPVKNISCFGGADGEIEAEASGGTPNYTFLWSNATTTALNSGLAPGTYTITITDANNCTSTAQTTITQPSQVGVTISQTAAVLCNGGNQGALLATGTNGTPGYNYSWSNAVNSAANTGLTAGTYTVTVTDANLCTATNSFTISEPTALSAAINTFNNPLCSGQSTGSATVTPNGGTPGYTYLWSNTATTQTINGLAAGTYTVTVNDVNNCTAITQITLNDLSTVTANINLPATNVSCFGGNDGAATVTPGGGAGGYSYLWSDNQTNQTANGLIAGTYTVTVSDVNGCTAQDQIVISEPSQLSVNITASSNPSCNGLSDGSATATDNGGGTGAIGYLWSNTATTSSISGLGAGTYTVTVTDANACTATDQITLIAPPSLSIAITSQIDVLCKGNNTGSLTTTITGNGTPGYTFLWSNSQTTQNATNLIAGSYTITITDANACTATATGTITEPATALTGTITGINATCNGFSDGSASIVASGGTVVSNYNYLWSNNETTASISGITSGTYTVTVTDDNNCPFIDQVVVGQNSVINTSTSSTNVDCYGDSTGTANITALPANPGYTYLWSSGSTNTSVTNLPAGKFYVTVTDPIGCFAIDSVTITQKDSIEFNITKFDATCNSSTDGIASVSGTRGGTPGYSFEWKTGSLNGPTISTFSTILNVAAGRYYIIVSDINGCSSADSVDILPSNPINLRISDTINVSCNGGADGGAVVAATNGAGGPYTYLWNNNQTSDTLKNVVAGTYTVTVTDNSTCTGSISIAISEPTPINTVLTSDSVSCFGFSDGSATATPTGGTPRVTAPAYDFLWSNSQTTSTINGLIAGKYLVTITDGNGCTKKDSVTVFEPTVLSASVTPSPALCKDSASGSATVTANGGTPSYSYLWSNNGTNQTQNNLLAGTYKVTVTDKNGCSISVNTLVGEPATGISSVTSSTNATCSGFADGTVSVTPSGGTPSALPPGYTFLWSNSATNQSLTGLTSNRYYVTITDGNGCTAIDSADVLDGISIFFSVDSLKMVDCNGGNDGYIEVSGINGTQPYSYVWANTTSTTGIANNLSAGSYTVTITDDNGCFKDTTFVITEPAQLDVSVTTNDISCSGKTDGNATATAINGTPGYSFIWSNMQTGSTINNLAAGPYSVTVTDTNGCTDVANFNINPSPGFTIVDSVNHNRCFGDCFGSIEIINVLNSTAPLTYTWNPIPPNGQGTSGAFGLCAGTYNLNIVDGNGCDTNLTYTITEPTQLTTVTNSTDATCSGFADGTATVTPNGGTPRPTAPGYTFLWSNTFTTQSISGLTSGKYYVTVTDGNGCTTRDSAVVQDGISIFVSLDSIRKVKCNGGNGGYIEVSGINGTTPYSYSWSNTTSTTGIADNLSAGVYTVTITDDNGCFKDTTITITEPNAITIGGTITNTSCNGTADGAIAASVSGGIPPYSYLWSTFSTNSSISNLSAGTYTVTVTDDSSCIATNSFTITPRSNFTFVDTIFNNNCFGDCNGSIEIFNLAGGTAPYTYTWSPVPTNGQGNSIASGLCDGTYDLTISDANGCDTSISYTLVSPSDILVNTTSTNSNCLVCNGTATATPSGGTPGYTYTWFDASFGPIGQTGSIANNLCAGVYNVVTRDAFGCLDTASVIVVDNNAPVISTSATDVSCFGFSDGTATVTGPCNPGVSCTVEWLNNTGVPIGQTTATATNLASGIYIVEVTAIAGCKAYDTVSVGTPTQIIANPGSTPVSCTAATICDATAFVAPTGGNGPYTYFWSTTATTDTIKNLCVGTYTVTITDNNNCSITTTINAVLGGSYVVTMNTVPETCDNSCDGEASVSIPAASFNPPYSYNWSPVPAGQQGNSSLNGLCSGTYNVTVTDGSGCTFTASNTVGTQFQIIPNDNFTNVSCGATCDGTATVIPTGGSGTYNYTWTPVPANGQGNNTATGLCAGPIEVLIEDLVNGCDTIVQFNISNSIKILPNEVVANAKCNGDCNGTISLAPTGGNGSAYTYVWTPVPPNGQGTPNANGLCAGTYSVVISDNGGCDTTLNITITEPLAISSGIAKIDATCNGSCDGVASVTPINGVAPYSYVWSNSLTTDTIKNLCAGTYTVTITDDNGCQITDQVIITEDAPILATTSSTPSTCDVCSGTATVTPSGAGPFTYDWFDNIGTPLGVTSQSIINRCAGLYSVEVTDQNTNCTNRFIIPISDFGGEVVTMSSTNESCIGSCDGTATASFTCSSPTCSIEWFDGATGLTIGQTTNTAINLCAGNYYVQVDNGVGCVTIETIAVGSPNPLSLTATSTDAACANSCDGTATASALGGTAPYRYVWSPAPGSGQGTANVTGLCVGTYNVQIFDANGCDLSTTVTVGSPQAVAVSFTSVDPDCGLANGSITATINGGSSPYSLQWFDGANTLLVGQTNPVITGLAAGSYTLRVRDNSSCEDFFTYSLSNTNGPSVTLDSTTNISCNGLNDGEIFISVSGGTAPYRYLWSPNGLTFEDITSLSAGSYTVRVTDANGCITFETYTISSPQAITANFNTNDAACGLCDGNAEVTISGGTAPYQYTWSNGSDSTKAVNLCAGIYVLNVRDANGCAETFNININNAGGPSNEIISVTDATCRNTCDGTATVTPIGGTAPYSYFWPHNGATTSTLNNLCAGSYFVQIIDANGCMRVASVVVDEPNELVLNSTITPATCNNFPCDGSILLNVTGGTAPYSFNWGPIVLPDTNYVDGLCAGSYSVDISDANGCIQTFTFVVSNTTIPINPVPTATDVSCFGSCDGTLTANITSALVDYQWFDANSSAVAAVNSDASGLCPGRYTLELTTIPDGCKYYETIDINEPSPLILTQPVVSNMNCATNCDGQVSINAIGGTLPYQFVWDDPNNQTANTATSLCAGTYNVVVTDDNGCSATTNATITAPSPIVMTVVSTTDVTCSSNCEGTAEISVAGGISPYTISWSGGQSSNIVTGLCFGPNLVTITDANNCEFVDTVFIAAQDTVVALPGADSVICDYGNIVLKGTTLGTGVVDADWYTYPSFNLFTTSLDTTFERSLGMYQFALIATNGLGCNDTAIKTIQVTPSPIIDAGRNVRIFDDEIAQIDIQGENSTYKYLWVPGINLSDSTIANPTSDTRETITYTLYVTDTNGCIGSDSMKVIYQEPITFPTGFTPNGDGTNDVWNLYFIADFPNTTVTIFNRWGENIFESNGYTKPWDGTYKGEALPSGTYYYIIDLNDPQFEPMTGPITIIR